MNKISISEEISPGHFLTLTWDADSEAVKVQWCPDYLPANYRDVRVSHAINRLMRKVREQHLRSGS